MAAAYKSNPDLLCVNFNQDCSCLATGTRQGYAINNCDPYGRIYYKTDAPASIVEMLFCTSLVALVGTGDRPSGSTRRLQIVNTKRESMIVELTFPTSILAVKMNRKRLVVVLEERIYVYDISNLKLLHEIETGANVTGIAALSPSSENSYLVYPSAPGASPVYNRSPPRATPAAAPGDVVVFDTSTSSVTNIIQAHKTPVVHVAVNAQGTLLATASDKGTVIRVFSLPAGERLFEFRRGHYPARIFSIAFNAASTLLAVSSDTETIHIFRLAKGSAPAVKSAPRTSPQPNGPSRLRQSTTAADLEADAAAAGPTRSAIGMLRRSSLSIAGNLLPGSVTSMFDPQRDFAFIKLHVSNVKSIVALDNTSPHVFVATSDGSFYTYLIDLEKGGECVLQGVYSLLDAAPSDSPNDES